MFENTIKTVFDFFGLYVRRSHHNTQHSLLGLQKRNIRTIIDIGANIGQSTRDFRQKFPDAKIYCFEPLPAAYNKLEQWAIKQNGAVKSINVGLGNQNGVLEFSHHLDHSPSSSFLQTTQTKENLYPQTTNQEVVSVEIKRLDDYLSEFELMSETLVKIDVQGYELSVIEGGKEVLKKASACILEVNLIPLYEEQASFINIVQSLYDLGFQYAGNLDQMLSPEGNVRWIDAVFTKPYL